MNTLTTTKPNKILSSEATLKSLSFAQLSAIRFLYEHKKRIFTGKNSDFRKKILAGSTAAALRERDLVDFSMVTAKGWTVGLTHLGKFLAKLDRKLGPKFYATRSKREGRSPAAPRASRPGPAGGGKGAVLGKSGKGRAGAKAVKVRRRGEE